MLKWVAVEQAQEVVRQARDDVRRWERMHIADRGRDSARYISRIRQLERKLKRARENLRLLGEATGRSQTMADRITEEPSPEALKSLLTTRANRRRLRELLALGVDPDLPPHLAALLDEIDEAEDAPSFSARAG